MITQLMLILAAVGATLSGVIAILWGGWSQPMTVLVILMGLDYISGLAVALVFRRSPKTESGSASSAIGLKGLLRKLFLILIVAAAYQIDKVINTNYLRDAVAITFIANETLSLIENAGLMGIPIPKVLLRGIDVLKGKADGAAGEEHAKITFLNTTEDEECESCDIRPYIKYGTTGEQDGEDK